MNDDIRERLASIEARLDTVIALQERQNGAVLEQRIEIDKLKVRMAYGIGFGGGLAVIWTILTTLVHIYGGAQ